MSPEQEPVSREMWYQQNLSMKETIKEIEDDIKGIHEDVKSISDSVEKILIQTTKTNGRVTSLEVVTADLKNYTIDKARVWGAVATLTVIGGAIITLSIMAINSKIKEGIRQAILECKDNCIK